MNLRELNKLEAEALSATDEAVRLEMASNLVEAHVAGGNDLVSVLQSVQVRWTHGSDALAKTELYAAVNAVKADLMKVAVLRLRARAHERRLAAAFRTQQIELSIVPTIATPSEAA